MTDLGGDMVVLLAYGIIGLAGLLGLYQLMGGDGVGRTSEATDCSDTIEYRRSA